MNQPLTTEILESAPILPFTCEHCGRVYDDEAACRSDDCPGEKTPLRISEGKKQVCIQGVAYSIPAWVNFVVADSNFDWWGFRDHPKCGHTIWYGSLVADSRMCLIVSNVQPDKHWTKTLLTVWAVLCSYAAIHLPATSAGFCYLPPPVSVACAAKIIVYYAIRHGATGC
nr:hypothetical protein [Providencia rettgeri]